MKIAGHTVRRASAADAAAIQALFATDLEYFTRVEGAPLRDDEGAIILGEVPPEFPLERKHIFMVDDCALLDMLEGYPDATTWFLGLIFLAPSARGRGMGTRLLEAVCNHARAHGARALRLAVATTNPEAEALYKRLGFQFVVRKQRTIHTGAKIDLLVLERAI